MAMTRQAGVIGYPLAHSISPQFQQPAFDALGLDVSYRAYETPHAALPEFVAGLRRDDWLGCNVTIPHKLAIAGLVDILTDEARQIGAVNTVYKDGGRLVGHNTDATGFLRALTDDAGFSPAGASVLMLGAGGAARAAAVALLRAGATRLWITNRTEERATVLRDRLLAAFPGAGDQIAVFYSEDGKALAAAAREATLLVNSTSVGMAHTPMVADLPLPASLLGPHLLVYDLVYNPSQTPLLVAAAQAGARTQFGLPMLIYQGAASFERWTGRPAPVAIMMEHGRRALERRG